LTNQGSQRGNPTTVKKLISGTNYATTKFTYFDTGQVATLIDACGNSSCSDMSGTNHTTTYSYQDSFSAGVPPGQTNAYLTRVTFPNTRNETFSWGYADGLLRSSNEQNGRTTSYQYSDPLLRLTQANYPDGGATTYSYNDSIFHADGTVPSNNTPNMTETETIASGVNKVSIAARDGLGHAVRSMLSSDPDG